MLNKTNAVETNKSTENFNQKMFSDEHAIVEQFEGKSIRFIKHHSIQIYKETINITQILKKITPNITNTLLTIQRYTDEILKESARFEQILENTPNTTNALETGTSFKESTLDQTKQIIKVLNKTNAFETNKSTENFNQEMFKDKHAIEQFKGKNIPSIEHHSIHMYTQTRKILRNSTKNTPNITNSLKTIQDYINRILEETERIEQILKNMPHTTNAPKSDATNALKNMIDRMNARHKSSEQNAGGNSPTHNN